MDILSLLRVAKSRAASDLHLIVSNRPMLRIHGVLDPISESPILTPVDIEDALDWLTKERGRDDFDKFKELDFGCTIPGIGRVRCNASRQQGTTAIAIRLLPESILDIDELMLPSICRDLVQKPRGMVIVSGPAGCGKSTTLAAMINHLNRHRNLRVVTIEDPVEYIYPDLNCIISQRELGTDTWSFTNALKHVLRQDPDVILVGEMRDADTAAAALSIAETGHLLLTTGHAPSASQAIERVIDLFPPHERHLVQSRLASLLIGVLCQTLVPRADGVGRIPAVEIMLANTAVKNLIRDGKIYQLPNLIQTHTLEGMQLLDQALIKLYRGKLITRESVFDFCNDHYLVERNILNGSKKPEELFIGADVDFPSERVPHSSNKSDNLPFYMTDND
ncbi:MAG TPA: PilT/PilU family type 4a pilus ATPase [Dehalococcoidia bacterium]|nr:PilT/PilU family type 4a pilus ATPase [Dehalococcoidia bacterium]